MGREIRMVPPNWEHPVEEFGLYGSGPIPMYDENFDTAADEWEQGYKNWLTERPTGCENLRYWEYEGGPPSSRRSYRPWKDEEATWFQVWETVTEGTPTTPPFATKEELIDYLANNGEFLNPTPWGIDRATAFVNAGWVPSMVFDSKGFRSGLDAIADT